MRAEYRYDYTGRRVIKKVFWKATQPETGASAELVRRSPGGPFNALRASSPNAAPPPTP